MSRCFVLAENLSGSSAMLLESSIVFEDFDRRWLLLEELAEVLNVKACHMTSLQAADSPMSSAAVVLVATTVCLRQEEKT
jgi:hypothetical protein